jgi:transposase
MDADLNAAKNIAARALVNRLIAAEEALSSSKPTALAVGN